MDKLEIWPQRPRYFAAASRCHTPRGGGGSVAHQWGVGITVGGPVNNSQVTMLSSDVKMTSNYDVTMLESLELKATQSTNSTANLGILIHF